MTAYYPQFQIVRIDADGYEIVAEDDDFEAYNVTQNVGLGTVHTDGFGIVPAGHFTASPGDIAEFSHGSYPLKFRVTLGATPELAANNLAVRYVAENLYDTTEPLSVELQLRDTDNPDAEPIRVGSGAPGDTVKFPLTSNVPKSFEVVPVTTDQNLNRGTFNETNKQTFSTKGAVIIPLWNLYDDVSNGDGDNDLFVGIIPDSLMTSNGDRVECLFAGQYASNSNEKYPVFKLKGTTIYAAAESPTGGFWKAEFSITRTSSTVARVEFALFTILSNEVVTTVIDVSGLDFTAPLTVICHATSDANDDVTLKVSHGTFYAASNIPDYLIDETSGDYLVDEDENYLTV